MYYIYLITNEFVRYLLIIKHKTTVMRILLILFSSLFLLSTNTVRQNPGLEGLRFSTKTGSSSCQMSKRVRNRDWTIQNGEYSVCRTTGVLKVFTVRIRQVRPVIFPGELPGTGKPWIFRPKGKVSWYLFILKVFTAMVRCFSTVNLWGCAPMDMFPAIMTSLHW